MTEEQSNTRLIQSIYEAFGRGDIPAILDRCEGTGPERSRPEVERTSAARDFRPARLSRRLTTVAASRLRLDSPCKSRV